MSDKILIHTFIRCLLLKMWMRETQVLCLKTVLLIDCDKDGACAVTEKIPKGSVG